MLDHISLGVSDLDRAAVFYDAIVAPLGYIRLFTTPRGIGYGLPGEKDEQFAILAAGAEARPPGRGCHFAFRAPSEAAVHAFFAAALAGGAEDEGPPGLRPAYGPGYYAAFVRDGDGYRLEAVFHGP